MHEPIFNIVDFGAQRDDVCPAQNAAAIQAAVDSCANQGGGTVFVPAGTFYCGNFALKSNVTLHLHKDALLMGSTDFRDYAFMEAPCPWAALPGIPQLKRSEHLVALIYAENAKNVHITGEGTIDGQGMEHKYFPDPEDDQCRLPFLIIFNRCQNVSVTNLTLKNPAFFTVFFVKSRDILAQNLNIDSYNTENGDGVDFDGSENALVANCTIKSGDDAISLKTSDPDYPCRNIQIENCTFTTVWAGFRIGTETAGDIQNITMTNCVFDGCSDGIKIQNCSLGTVSDFHISHITMCDVQRPFFITRSQFRICEKDGSIRPVPGEVTDLFISHLDAQIPTLGTDYAREGMLISGTPSYPIGNVVLEDIHVRLDKSCCADSWNNDVPEFLDYSFIYPDIFAYEGNLPTHGFFLRHIDHLLLKNVTITHPGQDKRPPIYGYCLNRLELDHVSTTHASTDMMQVLNSHVVFSNCESNGKTITQLPKASSEEQEALRTHLAVANALDQLFAENCQLIDLAEAMPYRQRIDPNTWKDESGFCETRLELKSGMILLIPTYGDFTLYLNGIAVATYSLPKAYENLVLWAYRVNEDFPDMCALTIRWHDISQRSGLDCALPFGEFRKSAPGLAAPVSICWE